jgi:hypothetical protein
VRILFDQGTPVPLREFLTEHHVVTAFERGWSTVKNGDLLDAAERDRFDVLLTTDSNMKYQHNLGRRQIAVVCLLSTSWPRIQKISASVLTALNASAPGSYVEIEVPGHDPK